MRQLILWSIVTILFIILFYVAKYKHEEWDILSSVFGFLVFLGIERVVSDIWHFLKNNDTTTATSN